MQNAYRKAQPAVKRESAAAKSRQFRAFLVQWARLHMAERVRFRVRS